MYYDNIFFFLNDKIVFPPVEKANDEGILAIGGDLSQERLLLAYRSGIFPWYSELPILWWSPNPRFVLFPNEIHISKSTKKFIKKNTYTLTLDTNFRQVISNCKNVNRKWQHGTWITDEMLEAYCNLHQKGYAHSVETWENGELVGGLYGVSLGKMFFGESMFSVKSNASKVAFIYLTSILQQEEFLLIDSQVHTNYLESMGGKHIPRNDFIQILNKGLKSPTLQFNWNKLQDKYSYKTMFENIFYNKD